jgi:predicted DCC family thiol-disulfide oxidoreductase YuxK
MKNGWTGGQYSLYRTVFGLYLLVHFAQLLPWAGELFSNAGVLADGTASPFLYLFPNMLAVWDQPAFVAGLLVVACGLSCFFTIGKYDRIAAVLLWIIWASLFGRNPLILNPSLPYIGLLLLVHAALPSAPFGSWTARGRVDPDGGWKMTPSLFAVVWILMSVGYSYSGYTKLISPSWQDGSAMLSVLQNPLARPGWISSLMVALPEWFLKASCWAVLGLELFFAPLALITKLRPWLWAMMLAMHFGLILVVDFADLSFGMVILHLFTLNPSWIPAKPATQSETLFYDGSCGLCHRLVRATLAEDQSNPPIRFAPLFGEAYQRQIPTAKIEEAADTLVYITASGEVLIRTQAVCHLYQRLGGVWRLLGTILWLVPRPMRDFGYNGVARVRHRLFARPSEACPLLPPHLQQRFDLG